MIRILAALLLFAAPALAGDLPDPALTPGVARTDLTLAQICSTKWGRDARAVTAAMKRQVFKEYVLTGNKDPPACRTSRAGAARSTTSSAANSAAPTT
jgi:hypothetical protein